MDTVFRIGDLVYPSEKCKYLNFSRRNQSIGIITHISDLPAVSGEMPHTVLQLYRNPFAYDDRFGNFHRNLFPLLNKTAFDFLINRFDIQSHSFKPGINWDLGHQFHITTTKVTESSICLVQDVNRALEEMPFTPQKYPATVYTFKEETSPRDLRSRYQKDLAARNYNRMTLKALEHLRKHMQHKGLRVFSSPRLSL